MNQPKPQIVRFLESLGVENVERFDLELAAKKDQNDKGLFHLNFTKETPWDYEILMEFLEITQRINYRAVLNFIYIQKPEFEDVESLFQSFCFNKYRIVKEIPFKQDKGFYIVPDIEETSSDMIDDFNDLMAFIGYGVKVIRIDAKAFEPSQPVIEEVKKVEEQKPVEDPETIPEPEVEEETQEPSDEELDAIGQDMISHQKEIEEAFGDYEANKAAEEAAALYTRDSSSKYRKGNYLPLESIEEIYDMRGGNFEISGTVFS